MDEVGTPYVVRRPPCPYDRVPGGKRKTSMQTDTTDSNKGFNEPSERYAVIIANPISGFLLHNTHRVHETLEFLRTHGWRAQLWFTHGPGDVQSPASKSTAHN